MPTHFRRLLLLPLLLLVPLGVAKWRANHPPLSEMDRAVRMEFSRSRQAFIYGSGPEWKQLTGLDNYHGLIIKDQTLLREMVETLRSTNYKATLKNDDTLTINIVLRSSFQQPRRALWTGFQYLRGPKGSCLVSCSEQKGCGTYVTVLPRFAPQFEVLVAHLAQRANVTGRHPKIAVERKPVEY